MSRQIVVDIIGDSSKYTTALDGAVKKTTGFGNVLKGVGMGIGFGAIGLATGAIDGLVSSLGDAKVAYDEDVASQEKMRQALKNTIPGWDGNTAAIEKVISAQQELGFADDAQRDSLALLVGATEDISEAQKLQAAAMDIARLKGIDLASATDIMIKANEGNYRGLKSLGITLDSAATKQEMLGEITRIAGGQAEAYAKGPLGKQEAAQLKVGEAMERIGSIVSQVASVVLPIAADAFTVIVDVLMEVWSAIQPVVSALASALFPIIKAVAGFVGGTLAPILKTLATVYFSTLGKVIGWLAQNVIPPLVAVLRVVFGVVGKVIGVVGDLAGRAVKNLGAAFQWLQTNVLTPIGKGLGLLGDGARALGRVFTTLSGAISRAWNSILGVIRKVINTIIRGWNSIKFEVPSIDTPFGRFGGFSIGTPNIPYLHSGGIVPGPRGSDQLAVLQAGERVLPMREADGGGGITIIFNGPVYGGPSGLDELSDMIAARMLQVG